MYYIILLISILFTVLIFIIIYNLVICRGLNMKCPHCYKNGSHFHLQNFSINTNHGPKTSTGFSHNMCKICMKNPSNSHFHLCGNIL